MIADKFVDLYARNSGLRDKLWMDLIWVYFCMASWPRSRPKLESL